MPNQNLLNQAQAQAVYMEILLREAALKAEGAVDRMAFDPQGRVLIDLTDDDIDYLTIAGTIHDKLAAQGQVAPLPADHKRYVLEAMGRQAFTDTITVSLDITRNDVLKDKFARDLTAALTEAGVNNVPRTLHAYRQAPKGSIIALQQEFHFHLGLATRTYQKTGLFADKRAELNAAHQAASKEVNALVMAAFAKALKGATKSNGTLDIAKLNKALDKARKDIVPEAHSILMKKIVRHTGVIVSPDKINEALKVKAESTTATPNDVLHSDQTQGLATLIEGSEHTAHHRQKGANFAHRQLVTHFVDAHNKITLNQNPRIQIRTPSLDIKKRVNAAEDLGHIQAKLTKVTDHYGLRENLRGGGADTKPKAFIYNLHTALNGWFDGSNKQNQGAERIQKAAHLYNAAQLQTATPVFCFVQNISVNGFADTLGYGTGDALVEESTLMTEMALMHSLYDSSLPAERVEMNKAFKAYKDYLADNDRPPYFSQSDEARAAKAALATTKTAWQANLNPADNAFENAQASLKHLVANNHHFNHDYAKLIQALSVSIEEASISGCKSGNERAQSVNGRVAILDNPSPAVKIALRNMATNGTPAHALALKSALDTAYNQIGLQGAPSIVSLLDQGASAKVEAKPYVWRYSTNHGEESASVMTNLSQSKAGAMQAHKGLTESMKGAWEGHPKSIWSLMEGVLGKNIISRILTVALYIPVAVVTKLPLAIYYAVKQNNIQAENVGLQDTFKLDETSQQEEQDRIRMQQVWRGETYRDLGQGLGIDPVHARAVLSDRKLSSSDSDVSSDSPSHVDSLTRPLLDLPDQDNLDSSRALRASMSVEDEITSVDGNQKGSSFH